jgi:hypothetical protein
MLGLADGLSLSLSGSSRYLSYRLSHLTEMDKLGVRDVLQAASSKQCVVSSE